MKQLQVVCQLVYDLAAITTTKNSACCPCMRVDCFHVGGPAPLTGKSDLHKFSGGCHRYTKHSIFEVCDTAVQSVRRSIPLWFVVDVM